MFPTFSFFFFSPSTFSSTASYSIPEDDRNHLFEEISLGISIDFD